MRTKAFRSRRDELPGGMAGRANRSAVFWFLLFLVMCETGAFIASPYRNHPPAAEVHRNPTPLRAWPEYVRGEGRPHGQLVVLIGTSQGLGLEFADDRQLFPARLGRALTGDRPGATLENWSVAGLRTDQIELLSLQAVKRKASVAVFLVSLGSIEEEWKLRLGQDAADLDLLAGDPVLWPMLARTAVFQNTRYHDLLLRALLLNTHLGRSRPAVLDIAAEHLAPEYHRPVFGSLRSRDARLSVAERLAGKQGIQFRSPVPAEPLRPPGYYEDQYRRRRLPVFDALYAGLRDRFTRAGIEMVWVWTPLAAGGFEDTVLKGAGPIHREICARIRADGWRCTDATHALPRDHFVVGDVASHLNDKGHEALARLLQPIVADALY